MAVHIAETSERNADVRLPISMAVLQSSVLSSTEKNEFKATPLPYHWPLARYREHAFETRISWSTHTLV